MTDMPLIVCGAGGHGLVVAESAAAGGWIVRGFVDDGDCEKQVGRWPVLDASAAEEADVAVHVAIGDNAQRRKVTERFLKAGRRIATIVHPSAWISPSAQIGQGVYVGPHAAVNAETRIGDGVIVNTAAVIEHHCRVGRFTHVAPHAVLTGCVHVGQLVLIGAGAVVNPGVHVGDGVTVGAGAAVVSDTPDGQTVTGVPARASR